MTPADYQSKILARVDEEIKRVQIWLDEEEAWTSQEAIDDANRHLRFLRALRRAIERHTAEIVKDWKITGESDDYYMCGSCAGEMFPCHELAEIAKELGI